MSRQDATTIESRAIFSEPSPEEIAQAAFLIDAWLADTGQENERLRFHDIRVLQPGHETGHRRVPFQMLAMAGRQDEMRRALREARNHLAGSG